MAETPSELRPHLDEFRRILQERRAALFAQVQSLEADRKAILEEQVPTETTEEGQEAELVDELTLLDARGQEEIATIDRALARIAGGEFGVCRRCGEPIPLARLRALPTAEMDVECAAEIESRQRAVQ